MFQHADPEVKRVAGVRFRGKPGMAFLLAGVSGMPLLWLAEMIGNAFRNGEEEPYDWLTDVRVTMLNRGAPNGYKQS